MRIALIALSLVWSSVGFAQGYLPGGVLVESVNSARLRELVQSTKQSNEILFVNCRPDGSTEAATFDPVFEAAANQMKPLMIRFVTFDSASTDQPKPPVTGVQVFQGGKVLFTMLQKEFSGFITDTLERHLPNQLIEDPSAPSQVEKVDPTALDLLVAENRANGGYLIVDLTATWCGPCQRFKPLFEAWAKLNQEERIKFAMHDVSDFSQPVIQRYKIDSVPRILIFHKGALYKNMSAWDLYDELLKIKAALKKK